ncbi:sulfatase family protein [Urechidicola vernalis]|uniref:Sulfatase n=1 Tax=Urechidicola vernalis TaxID=3075600 RepID=A0ABU2Y103_9FLAO|nr:sulfatase [Urechidicola sp. P050]MDT0551856.1 sulfatase [Urechidicola sp. P050]
MVKSIALRRVFVGIGILLSVVVNSQEKELPPPNIVWLVSEDNSMHYLKMFNDNGVATPNIEGLAEQGLTYTRAFSNAAVCSSARSTLISGTYGPRLASHYHRKLQKVPMPTDLEMFPAYLRKAGYYTTNNNKEDYNFKKKENVWDESSNKASYKNRKKGQPFFHVYNTGITHEGKLHFKKGIVKNKKTQTSLESFTVQPNHPDTELFKYTNAYYRDKIVQMDTQMGTIIQQLKDDGLYDNTIIFYYGDHGGVLPGSKGYLYETGLHVPLVVHIPEMYKHLAPHKLGGKVGGFVSFVDFGATVLSLAGVEIPENMDGEPFLGMNVSEKEVNSRDETFSYADRFDEKYDMVRALRKGKYKYIRNYQPFNFDGLLNQYRYKQLAFQEWADLYAKGELNEVQASFYESRSPEMLFDVENDPYETNNLAKNPEYKSILQKMRKGLNAYEMSMPDLSFYPEHYLIKNAFQNPELFGQKHKKDILKYIKIADLSLGSFENSKKKLEKALNSNDPWERYWALIVCSTFGKQAKKFNQIIKDIANNDSERINKIRALEFIGLTGAQNPLEEMASILVESESVAESLLITNTMVLMTDGPNKYRATMNFDQVSEEIKTAVPLVNRFEYLTRISK